MAITDNLNLRRSEVTDEPIFFEFYELQQINFETITLKLTPLHEL